MVLLIEIDYFLLTMVRKKITIIDATGSKRKVLVSSDGECIRILQEFGVANFLDDEDFETLGFESLVDGDTYRLGRSAKPHIFSHGLPPMGPLSETTKFTSNPSVPTEEQHASAQLKISSFTTLSDLGNLPYPKTIFGTRSGGTLALLADTLAKQE